MKIAIRLDDITADMDRAKFDRMRTLLDHAGIRPLIGVVPDPQDPKLHHQDKDPHYWDLVHELEAAGWVIAMHGLTHVYATKDGGMLPLNHQSEFAGRPYEEQAERIRRGRALLEAQDIHTDIFMAPSHTYDENTLKALLANGFTRMTDGFGDHPYTWHGMTFYPISFNRGSVLRNKDSAGFTTFVYHTNVMEESDFASLERLLAGQDVISYEELLAVPATPQSAFARSREYAMAAAKQFLVSHKR